MIELKNNLSELIKYYYDLPDKGAGGYLHIVLDDGNVDYGCVLFCQDECEKNGDTLGYLICDLLYEFTEDERSQMYKKDKWGVRAKKIDTTNLSQQGEQC